MHSVWLEWAPLPRDLAYLGIQGKNWNSLNVSFSKQISCLILFLLLISHALHINFPCTFMVGCIVVLTAVWYGIRFCWSHTIANHTYSSLIKMILILSGHDGLLLLCGHERGRKYKKDQKSKKNGQYYPIISFFKSLILLKWFNGKF